MRTADDRSDEPWVDWLIQLSRWWLDYTDEYLCGAMRPPSFRFSGSTTELGRWHRQPRIIEISKQHVIESPWPEVLCTLRHEMAHQYADEVLLALDEVPHGPAFQRACRLLRVEPAASGPLGAATPEDPVAGRVQRVVEKLLALGGSPNENEAAAAMRKARALMLEHNVDAVRRDAHRSFVMKALGTIKKRHAACELALGGILTEFFFVEAIWAPDYHALTRKEGKSLQIYGTPANVVMAEYVHGYLAHVVADLWTSWKRARGLRGERARLQYFDGVLLGFQQKLREQGKELATAGTALVWRGDPRLDAFFRWHNPRIRMGGGRSVALTEAHVAGREAGRQVTIHRPLTERGGSGGLIEG